MESNFEGRKPEILYPCLWSYQVIGTDEQSLRAAVLDVIGPAPHNWHPGRASTGGKYISLGLELRVEDDAERLAVFKRLSTHPSIRFVL